MSCQINTALRRWLGRWRVAIGAKRGGSKAPDFGLVTLTLLNVLLLWLWHLLRVDYDAGVRHPLLVLAIIVLILWTWSKLVTTVVSRLQGIYRQSRGNTHD